MDGGPTSDASVAKRDLSNTDDPPGAYSVDPTGCFTIADTDLAPGPGTRLVLIPE
jgi:hypothetical protein